MATVNTSEVIVRHPGSQVEGFIYPSKADSAVSLARVDNVGGKVRVTSNSLSMAATSNFTISSSDILYGLCLNAQLTVPASNVISAAGWLFSLIQRIEVVYPNSASPSLNISGQALLEYMLATCQTEPQRIRLLQTAGMPAAAGSSPKASIPMWWLLGSALGTSGNSYPLDMSTLTGSSIQINITFYPSTYIICRTGAVPSAALVAFDALYMTGSTTTLDNKALGVRPLLMADPYVSYPLHGKGIQGTTYNLTFALDAAQTINLQSAPDAGLNAIILSIKPAAEYSANGDGTSNYLGSVPISQVQLTQGGDILFQANNRQEYLSHLREMVGGDELLYRYAWDSANSSAAAAQDLVEQGVNIIPFNFHAKQVLTHKLVENMASYSNRSLQLQFTPTARSVYDASASPFYASTLAPRSGSGSQAYIIEVIYITTALLDIDSSGVRIIY